MEIEEVADILGLCHALRILGLPKHIFVTEEKIRDSKSGTYFRGLQPKNRRDVIFLSGQADSTTVPHEVWHALTGLGEATAYPIGKALQMKHRIFSKFPMLKQIRSKPVKYKEVKGSSEFPTAKKYGKRIRHFELVG